MFQSELNLIFSELNNQFDFQEAVAIAGTATTVACMCFGLNDFIEEKVESASLNSEAIKKLVDHISNLTSSEILDQFGKIVNGREDIILAGATILFSLMKKLKLNSVRVSSWGVRHGAILFKHLSKT